MARKKTALRIDEALWANAKLAARSWASRLGLNPEGKTTEWLALVLRKAAAEELGEAGASGQGGAS